MSNADDVIVDDDHLIVCAQCHDVVGVVFKCMVTSGREIAFCSRACFQAFAGALRAENDAAASVAPAICCACGGWTCERCKA